MQVARHCRNTFFSIAAVTTSLSVISSRSASSRQIVPAAAFFLNNRHKNISSSSSSKMVATSTTNKENDNGREEKDAKFWDKMADGYSKSPIADMESYQKKLDITREFFSKTTTEVFEFGCGTGSTALLHAPYVKQIYATDLSPKMIEIARAKAIDQGITNVKFEATSIDTITDDDNNQYDVILGLSILHLVPNRQNTIVKVHKMLKPGGVFVSSTPCIGDMGMIVGGLFKLLGPLGHKLGLIPQVNAMTVTQLKDSLTESGFTIEREFQPSKDKACFLVAKKKNKE